MAIILFDLNTKSWSAANVQQGSQSSSLQQLLVNMYIEMRVQTQYLEAIANGKVILDDPQALRVDVTQDF